MTKTEWVIFKRIGKFPGEWWDTVGSYKAGLRWLKQEDGEKVKVFRLVKITYTDELPGDN